LVKPRSYWFSQEHPGIYQELAGLTQELRPEIPAHEYVFPFANKYRYYDIEQTKHKMLNLINIRPILIYILVPILFQSKTILVTPGTSWSNQDLPGLTSKKA
jgi:hypothetical protein